MYCPIRRWPGCQGIPPARTGCPAPGRSHRGSAAKRGPGILFKGVAELQHLPADLDLAVVVALEEDVAHTVQVLGEGSHRKPLFFKLFGVLCFLFCELFCAEWHGDSPFLIAPACRPACRRTSCNASIILCFRAVGNSFVLRRGLLLQRPILTSSAESDIMTIPTVVEFILCAFVADRSVSCSPADKAGDCNESG